MRFASIVLSAIPGLLLLSACSDAGPTGPEVASPEPSPFVPGFVAISASTSGPGARDYLYAVEIHGGRYVLYPGDTLHFEALEGSVRLLGVPAHCSLQSDSIAFVIAQADTLAVNFPVACGPDAALEIAAVGVAGGERALVVGFDGGGGRAVVLAEGRNPAWSPDGSRIAYLSVSADRERVRIIDPATGISSAVGSDLSASFGAIPLAWSPDGSRIAVVTASEILLIAASGAGETAVPLPGIGELASLDWSPDGDSLAVASVTGLILIAADGTGSVVVPESGGFFGSVPSWSPDGSRIAFARTMVPSFGGCWVCDGWDGWTGWFFGSRGTVPTGTDLFVAGTDGSAPRLLTPTMRGGGFAWSPDGSSIAFTGDFGLVYLISSTGESAASSLGIGRIPSWTADGRLRVAGDAIVTMRPDGTDQQVISEWSMLSLVGEHAAWRP